MKGIILILVVLVMAGSVSAYNVYYGNLHAHCEYSDGIGTPQHAYEYARDTALVDVEALTDHSHMLSASEYSNMRAIAAAYTEDGVFVALAGQEHGSLSTTHPGAFGHMNFYEATTVIPQYDNGGSDFRYNLAGTYSWLVTHTDGILGNPLYAVFNHPYYTGGCEPDAQFHHFAYSVTGDSAMSLTEIRNGRRADSYEPEYFDVLSKGWHVGVAANQDNHEGMWGDQPNPYSGNDIYLTGILADTLTKEAILTALKDRRTFAVEVNPKSDRMAILFQCEGHWMGDVFETAADTVHFDITVWAENDFISVELIRNGLQVDYASPGTNYYEWQPEDDPPMGESYYFVRAQQTDGDYLWSSPIWVISTSEEWDPISAVNEDDSNGEPVLLYQQVTIKGRVTAGTGTFSSVDNYIFVQDATGGVNVVKRNSLEPFVSVGDSLTVSGTVDQSAGLTKISSPTITVEATGLGEPQALLITTGDIESNGETYEGLFVKVEGCSLTAGTWPDEGSDGSVTIDDGSGGCTLFIDSDTDIDGSTPPAGRFDVVGIVTQYDPSFPYWSGYRLMPRSTSDIFPTAGVASADEDVLSWMSVKNPGRGTAELSFAPGVTKPRTLTFYDVNGRKIDQITISPGETKLIWPSTRAKLISSGIYFAVLDVGGKRQVSKIILMR